MFKYHPKSAGFFWFLEDLWVATAICFYNTRGKWQPQGQVSELAEKQLMV